MANSKHLIILDEGPKAWNKWRKENSKIKPDLRNADLGGADLSKADLSKASLQGTDLRSQYSFSSFTKTVLSKISVFSIREY